MITRGPGVKTPDLSASINGALTANERRRFRRLWSDSNQCVLQPTISFWLDVAPLLTMGGSRQQRKQSVIDTSKEQSAIHDWNSANRIADISG